MRTQKFISNARYVNMHSKGEKMSQDIYNIEHIGNKFGKYIADGLFAGMPTKSNKTISKKISKKDIMGISKKAHVVGGLEILQMLLTISKDIDATEKNQDKFDLLLGEIELMTIASKGITDNWDLKRKYSKFELPDLREGYKYWSFKQLMEKDIDGQ